MKLIVMITLLTLVLTGLYAGARGGVHVGRGTEACVLPSPSSSNTITTPFAIQVLCPESPVIHGRRMNFWPAGGGDQHLYLGPTAGNPISNLTLMDGVITTSLGGGPTIRAVINGEVTISKPKLALLRVVFLNQIVYVGPKLPIIHIVHSSRQHYKDICNSTYGPEGCLQRPVRLCS